MKHLYFARDERCSLEPLDETDTELLRRWRNRADLSRFLQPLPPISQEEQKAWYARYLEDADTLFFAIKDGETGKTIGTVALYHLMQNCCEIGKIVIGDEAVKGRGMGTRAVFLALGIAFYKLGMTGVNLNVHLENIAALTIYVRVGFEINGSHPFISGGKELEMHLDRKRFEACNPRFRNIHFDKAE